MPPAIHLIADLGAAIMVIARHRDGRTVVLVSPAEPRQLLLGIARPLLEAEHRHELARVLSGRRRKR